jgi:hypothetical protein
VAKASIITGILLIAVGVVGATVAASMVDEWWYAGIPAIVGLLIFICGKLAAYGRGRAKTPAMAIALLIAVVGIIGSFMPSGLNFSAPGSVAFISSIFRLLTIVIAGGFVALCTRSFFPKRNG